MARGRGQAADQVYLREGSLISVNGRLGTVKRVNMTDQTVAMHWAGDRKATTVTLDSIVHAVDLRPGGVTPPRPARLHLVTDRLVLASAAERLAHALEAATGYRSGDPEQALPHEPRPEYDPAHVLYHDRFANKADALRDDPSAVVLRAGLGRNRLRQIAEAYLNGDTEAALDRRSARTTGSRRSVGDAVEAVFLAVHEELRTSSNRSMRNRIARIGIKCRADIKIKGDGPSASTVKRWHYERYSKSELNGRASTRRSATKVPEHGWFRHTPAYPGELVVADTNNLDVLLKGTWWEGRVSGSLVACADWFSHSVFSLRVVESTEKAVDVGRCLIDAARPKAMRANWAGDLRWAYAGLPEKFLMLPPGTCAAALPYASVAAWVLDHGATYKAKDPLRVAERMGSDVMPARKGTPADKAVIERFFGTLNTMLLQWLDSHRGSGVSERGLDIEGKIGYTAREFEDLLLHWVMTVYQNHILEGVTPPWTAEGEWSPNRLYEEGLSRHGVSQPLMSSDLYYEPFARRYAAVKGRGVKIGRLWYDNRDGALDGFRDVPNPYGAGKEKNRHEFRVDPYDHRSVFWRHPQQGVWHRLDWVAGSRETLPVFGDADARLLNKMLASTNCPLLNHEQALQVLIKDVLHLDQPPAPVKTGKTDKAGQAASRRRRAAQAEVETRRAYGVGGTPAEQEQDPARSAEQTVDAARASRRHRVVTAVPRPAPPTTRDTTPVPAPAPAPAAAQPDLRVVQDPAPPVPAPTKPEPQQRQPVVPVPAPPLGGAYSNPFSRLGAGSASREEDRT